jgi:hypothetical protein
VTLLFSFVINIFLYFYCLILGHRSKEKWSASGGSELLSSVSSQIPQETKSLFGDAQKKIFNRQHLRTPVVYFGIGEERPFYVEKTIKHNFSFFYMNYMLVAALLFVLTLLISPGAIIGIGLLGLAWAYVIKATQDGSTTIKGMCFGLGLPIEKVLS